MNKQSYYRTITILGSIIILQIIFIAILLTHPIVETQVVEVPKEVIIEKEIVVEKEVPVEVIKEVIVTVEKEPEYTYNVTSEEREMLARIVHQEANIESIECQKAIVSVIINRWQNGYWGDTLKDVIYYKGQFSPSYLLYKTTPNETNYEAVDFVLKNGCTLPDYCMYFRANYHFSWDGYSEYTIIDSTYFGYLEQDK